MTKCSWCYFLFMLFCSACYAAQPAQQELAPFTESHVTITPPAVAMNQLPQAAQSTVPALIDPVLTEAVSLTWTSTPQVTCSVPIDPGTQLHPVTSVVSSTVILYQYWSPNKQHFVIDGEQDGQYHSATTFSTIYASKQEKSTRIPFRYQWGGIVGWTADSRYALFGSGDQYGNSEAIALDTQDWRRLDLNFSRETNCGIGTACRQNVVAIAPQTSRVILADGNLVDLTDMTYTNILTSTGRSFIGDAAWSPDESHFIFTAYHYKDNYPKDFALFIAKGGGTHVRFLFPMKWFSKSIGWGTDGQCASIITDETIYTFDLAGSRVWVEPVAR